MRDIVNSWVRSVLPAVSACVLLVVLLSASGCSTRHYVKRIDRLKEQYKVLKYNADNPKTRRKLQKVRGKIQALQIKISDRVEAQRREATRSKQTVKWKHRKKRKELR